MSFSEIQSYTDEEGNETEYVDETKTQTVETVKKWDRRLLEQELASIIQGIIDLQERKTEIEAQIAKFKAVEK